MATSHVNTSKNAERDARLLYLRQQSAATQGPKTTGAPVAMEEVVVTAKRPSFEEIQEDTRRAEWDFATGSAVDFLKGTVANLAGLPMDLVNLVNTPKLSGRNDYEKGTSAHIKGLLGVDPGSFGSVVSDINPADPLSKVGALGGLANQAGFLVPAFLWKNKEEAAEALKASDSFIRETGMDKLPIGDQWRELNRQLFERTNGWMLDFNGTLRRFFAPNEGGLNPGIIKSDGSISLAPNATLKDIIAPEVWADFDESTVGYIQDIPVENIFGSRASWSDRSGIGVQIADIYKDPAAFISSIHHEMSHAFDAMVGSDLGSAVKPSLRTAEAELSLSLNLEPLEKIAHRQQYPKQALQGFRTALNAHMKHKYLGAKAPNGPDLDTVIRTAERLFGPATVSDYVKSAEQYMKAYAEDYSAYKRVAGEVLARSLQKSHVQGEFPLANIDIPMEEIVRNARDKPPLGIKKLPYRNEKGDIMVGDVTTKIIQMSAKPMGIVEAEIQAGKWDDEIQRLLREQKADAVRDRSQFRDPVLNAELEEARQRLGVSGPVRPERPERLNESFPSTTDRPTLMRSRNTQGARLDDTRGGPPTRYEGFGQMMEGAELLATGREEVWKSGAFNIEAFQGKVEKLARQRAVVAAKGSVSQATSKVKLEPKFWAFDPDTGKIAVVTAKQSGGFEIKYKTGKITDAVMDKVDIVANREGLNAFISKTLWKRATGEPITYLDPTASP